MNPTISLLLETLAPGLLVAGVALVALPWLRPNDERARAAVVAVVVVLMWRYMVWRWLSTLPPVGTEYRLDRRRASSRASRRWR